MNANLRRRIQHLEATARQRLFNLPGVVVGPGLDGLSDDQLDLLIDDLECGRDVDPTLFAGMDIEAIAPGATEQELDNLISNLRIAIRTCIH